MSPSTITNICDSGRDHKRDGRGKQELQAAYTASPGDQDEGADEHPD